MLEVENELSHCFLLVLYPEHSLGIMEKITVMTTCLSFVDLPCFMRGNCVVFMPHPSIKHSALSTTTTTIYGVVNFMCQLN